MAYTVEFDAEARRQAGALPSHARRDLAAAIERIAADPWAGGTRYYPRLPSEFRIATFGSLGVAAYLIREHRQAVLVLQITYAG